ncbi:MAG TPA: hypothetical protein VG496_19185 [Myxococcales bacterium]|nr:hypothetical protein [Myxococcales bacterium]
MPELVVSLLVELPIPVAEPLLVDPPEVSETFPEPLFFSGVVPVAGSGRSVLLPLVVDPVSGVVLELDVLRLGERPVRPSGRAFLPSPTTPVPGKEPVSELVVPGSLAAPVLPPVDPS